MPSFGEAVVPVPAAGRVFRGVRILAAAGAGKVARQGEAANSMHFILEGRVGVIVELRRSEDGLP